MMKFRLQLCAAHLSVASVTYTCSSTSILKRLGSFQYSQSVSELLQLVDDERLKDKIIYNSKITPKHYLEVFRQKKITNRYDRKQFKSNIPISLSLLEGNSFVSSKQSCKNDKLLNKLPSTNNSKPNLPFQYCIDYEVKDVDETGASKEVSVKTGVSVEPILLDGSIKGMKKWMNDYENYCSVEEAVSDNNDWLVNYGTADVNVPVSKIACGGCGAYLHCKDPSLPGYLPSEIFLECTSRDLRSLICQRCHFLKNYNTALSVHVNPEVYDNLISKIKTKALVVLLVDMTDIGGSIWPGITDIIGKDRSIFLVGNKVDLLWGDRVGWLKHVDSVLKTCVPSGTKILDTCLISAKTGFGVEEMITKLHGAWKGTDDVYIVGCTNVGKSTLFNALIQSDYCKTKAVDLVQRATTAPWPGTTLNLLKFPILRPAAWRVAVRNVRLNKDKSRTKAETQLKRIQASVERKRPTTPPQLIGNISHTFKQPDIESEDNPDLFSLPKKVNNSEVKDHHVSLVDSKDRDFEGRWCYDTPGVLHKNQILNLLTTEELLLTIPRSLIVPRTFLVYEEMSLFIASLARLDYIKGERGIRVTVFSSNELPVTICHTKHAEEVYNGLLGSELSLVPQGSEARLKEWPGLTALEPVSLCGIDKDESCADIAFTTTGWISVTPERNQICKLLAWSPIKEGVSIRYPSILPFAVKLRGKKIPRSSAYSRTQVFK